MLALWVLLAAWATTSCATFDWTVEECSLEAERLYSLNGSSSLVVDYDTLMCCADHDCRSIGY